MTLENAVQNVTCGASRISLKFVGIAPIPSLRGRGDLDKAFPVFGDALSQKGAEISQFPFSNIIDNF